MHIVQMVDNTIQWANRYPADKCSDNLLCYPADRHLSNGIMHYLLLEQWWPESDRELHCGKLWHLISNFFFQGNPWWTTENNWFNWCQWKWWCWYLDSCWGCWWLCDRTYRKETEGLFLLTSPILSIFSFSWKFYCIIFKMFKLSEQNSFMGLISYTDLW